MRDRRIRPTWKRLRGFLAAVAMVALVVSCGDSNVSGSSVAGSAGSHTPSAATATHAVHKTTQVRYQQKADGTWYELTVFSPVGVGGPWPTVVMIHGAGEPDYFYPWARNVARRGLVVFVPDWWQDSPKGEFKSPQQFRHVVAVSTAQLTCAVRFARTETTRYGGDPTYLSLYGHSAGANYAAQIAFAEPQVAPGCAASADSAAPDNLVLTDGDWLLLGAGWWTPFLRKDPGIMDVFAPWSHLATATRIPVHILDTGDPSMNSKDAGYGAPKTWLPLRDPTGVLQRGLERRHAFADGTLTETEMERLLYDELTQNGYDATFHTLRHAHHMSALVGPAHLRIGVEAMLADK